MRGLALLESFGPSNKGIQAAEAAKYTEGIPEAGLLQSAILILDQGRVSCVLQGVLHSENGDVPQDVEEDDDEWFDLGDQDPAQRTAITQQKIRAVDHGTTTEGNTELSLLLSELQDVIKLNLRESPPAWVEPLKISLKPNTQHVRTRQRQLSGGRTYVLGPAYTKCLAGRTYTPRINAQIAMSTIYCAQESIG